MIMRDLDLEDFNDDSDLDEDSTHEDTINIENDQKNNSHKDHIKITDIKDITEDEKSKNQIKEAKVDAKDDKIDTLGEKLEIAKIEAIDKTNSQSKIDTEM